MRTGWTKEPRSLHWSLQEDLIRKIRGSMMDYFIALPTKLYLKANYVRPARQSRTHILFWSRGFSCHLEENWIDFATEREFGRSTNTWICSNQNRIQTIPLRRPHVVTCRYRPVAKCINQFQRCPSPPPGNHGAFAQMSVPGVGH